MKTISDLGKMTQESRACFCPTAVELYIVDIREIFVELIAKRVSIS